MCTAVGSYTNVHVPTPHFPMFCYSKMFPQAGVVDKTGVHTHTHTQRHTHRHTHTHTHRVRARERVSERAREREGGSIWKAGGSL